MSGAQTRRRGLPQRVDGAFQERFLCKHACLFVAPFISPCKNTLEQYSQSPTALTLPSQRRAGLPGSLVALVTASDPASWCCFLTPLSQTHLCSHPPFSYVFLLPSGSHFFPRSLVHSFALSFSVRDLLQQSLSSQRTAANHKNQNIFLFIWLCRVSAAALGISVCRAWTLSLRGLSCFSSRGILVPRPGSNLRPLLCKVDS